MLDTRSRKYIQKCIDKVATTCIKVHLTANKVTLIAFIIGILSALSILISPILAIILLWLSGLFDVVDGSIARLTKTSSKLGMMYDIISDRIVEALIIIILAYKYSDNQFILLITLATFIVSITVFLVSGGIIKIESMKSFYYTPTLTERTETFIYLSLMIIFPQYICILSVVFIVLVWYSIIDRVIKVHRYLKSEV